MVRSIFCIGGCNVPQNKLQYGYNLLPGGVTVLKERILCGLLCAVLLSGLAVPAYAEEEPPVVQVTVDGELAEVEAFLYGGTSYFPLEETILFLYPEAEVSCEEGVYTAKTEAFTVTAAKETFYLVVNGR